MQNLEILLPERKAETFGKILLPLALPKNKEKEMVFSTNLINYILKAEPCPCYRFAFNLEGDAYWRLRIGKITLEYIVLLELEADKNNAYVYQIFNEGQLIYRRVDEPKDVIYVHYKANTDNS